MQRKTRSVVLFSVVALIACTTAISGVEADDRLPPREIYDPPAEFLLLQLVGDATDTRYTPGSLDRSANLQVRLELLARAFAKWADVDLGLRAFVLGREEWERAGYPVPYGMPVRVGKAGLAAPARGDDGTIQLWSGLLGGRLPVQPGIPIMGTPEEAATMLTADVIGQLLVSQMLVDELDLTGDERWVRGVASHVVSSGLVGRIEPGRSSALDIFFATFAQRHPLGTLSTRDDLDDLGLEDWLWFQAQYYFGARTLLVKESGKDAVKRLRKMRKKNGGTLRADALLGRYEGLRTWYRETFSAVSTRTGQ